VVTIVLMTTALWNGTVLRTAWAAQPQPTLSAGVQLRSATTPVVTGGIAQSLTGGHDSLNQCATRTD